MLISSSLGTIDVASLVQRRGGTRKGTRHPSLAQASCAMFREFMRHRTTVISRCRSSRQSQKPEPTAAGAGIPSECCPGGGMSDCLSARPDEQIVGLRSCHDRAAITAHLALDPLSGRDDPVSRPRRHPFACTGPSLVVSEPGGWGSGRPAPKQWQSTITSAFMRQDTRCRE